MIAHPNSARLTQIRSLIRVRRRIGGTQGSCSDGLLLSRIRLIKGCIERFFSTCQQIYFLLLQAIVLYPQHAVTHVVEFEVCAARGTSVPFSRINFILLLIVVSFEIVQISCTSSRKIHAFTKS